VANFGEDEKRTSLIVVSDNKRIEIETKAADDGEAIKVRKSLEFFFKKFFFFQKVFFFKEKFFGGVSSFDTHLYYRDFIITKHIQNILFHSLFPLT
jgi:hypothetical protein